MWLLHMCKVDADGSSAAVMQADSTHKHVKDLDVVLGSDTAAVIVDDTPAVWGHRQRNVLQVGSLS
jgi:RNA polymerase II C-terminal domain phosphatase-like 3/4